jgi:hypothetical protein
VPGFKKTDGTTTIRRLVLEGRDAGARSARSAISIPIAIADSVPRFAVCAFSSNDSMARQPNMRNASESSKTSRDRRQTAPDPEARETAEFWRLEQKRQYEFACAAQRAIPQKGSPPLARRVESLMQQWLHVGTTPGAPLHLDQGG